jgi:RNA polymerase sigma-70 factor (ECF subfamily)
VFRYLYARIGQREVAEDLTADVFVRLLQNLPRFRVNAARPVASFSAFVYRVAGNLLTDQYRKQKHRDHQDIDDQPFLADKRPEPFAQTAASENRNELMDAVSKLGAEQQAVLLYRFGEEFSVLEVAEIMGKTTGAIKALQHRAITNLRRILTAEAVS